MKNSLFGALALALATTFALPATADEHAKRFPMPAAEFQEHVDARIQRARARLENAIAEKSLPDDQANALRAHLDTVVANVKVEVQKAVADGVVTLDEAKAVHAVSRELHAHHRGQ
jgi:hypothetical protein